MAKAFRRAHLSDILGALKEDGVVILKGTFGIPPIVPEEVFPLLIKCNYSRRPDRVVNPVALEWKREIVPLFDLYTQENSEWFTLSLPDFYYSCVLPLEPSTRENGALEVMIGSHRHEYGKIAQLECQLGDLIILNGKCLRRRIPNLSQKFGELKCVIYCADWYLEK